MQLNILVNTLFVSLSVRNNMCGWVRREGERFVEKLSERLFERLCERLYKRMAVRLGEKLCKRLGMTESGGPCIILTKTRSISFLQILGVFSNFHIIILTCIRKITMSHEKVIKQ